MDLIIAFIAGGIWAWVLGRAAMFDSIQTEIKERIIDQTYSAPEVFGLREHLRRWYCKHKFCRFF